jgi:O-antigen/teichoic acid export membrane protein
MTSTYLMVSVTALALLQWIIMAVIARIDGAAVLGQYALAQAYAVPAVYLAWLSIRQQVLISDHATPLSDFVALRIFAPLPIFGAAALLQHVIYADYAYTALAVVTLFNRYVEGFFDLAYGRMQSLGRSREMASATVVRCAISALAFIGVYKLSGSLLLAMLLMTAVSALMGWAQRAYLSFDPPWAEVLDVSAEAWKRRAGLAWANLPFAVSLVLMALTTNAPRVLVESQFGSRDLGFFTAVSHFVLIGSLAVGSLGQSLLPRFARATRDGDARAFWRMLLASAAAVAITCALAAVVASLAGDFVVRLIYGAGFAGLGALTTWAALTSAPVYAASMFMSAVYGTQARRLLLASQALSLACVVPATWLTQQRFGLPGAFLGPAIAALAQILFCAVFLRQRLARRRESAVLAAGSSVR